MPETPPPLPRPDGIPADIPRGPGLKLNIGCGFNKLDGYVNLDGFADCAPDVVWDLERTPWPFPDDSVDEIVAHHVLEHIGQATGVFFAIVKEIYRVLRHGGEIRINVPHPLHRSFMTDPTHVRAFTSETFLMLSRERNLDWAARKVNVTMLALMLDVNFVPVEIHHIYDKPWHDRLTRGEITAEQLREEAESRVGVIREIAARLRVDKRHLGRGA